MYIYMYIPQTMNICLFCGSWTHGARIQGREDLKRTVTFGHRRQSVGMVDGNTWRWTLKGRDGRDGFKHFFLSTSNVLRWLPDFQESRTLWECTFSLLFKTVITLKLKLQTKLCSCPLESMYCLKKCPGVHSTWDKCYYIVPSTRHHFCRIC